MALLTDIINSIIVKVNAKLNRSGDTMTGDLTVPNLHTAGLVDGRDVSADGTKLDTIETGATADQTPSEILSALVTVDGAGSGLDADTLDGLDSTQFLRSDVEDTYTSEFLNLSNTTASISMDDQNAPDGKGIRRITCNDGGGNWSFRSGAYFKTGVGLSYTTAGFGATSIIHSTDTIDGTISLKVAPKSVNADDPVTWSGIFDVTQTGIFFNGNTVWHSGNDSNLAKIDTANKFTGYPQTIQSDVNDTGFFDGVRQDGTRQYLLGATGSTIPLSLMAYDVDGTTILSQMYFTSSGNIALSPQSGSSTDIHSDLILYPTGDTSIEIYSPAGKGSFIRGRATDGITAGWHVGRSSATSDELYLTNYIPSAGLNLTTNGGLVKVNGNEVWHAGNDSNLAKLNTPNMFTGYPQTIQSDVNGLGYFDGVRQDGTQQYLIGATGSATPLDLVAYDLDGLTVLGRIVFTSSGLDLTANSGAVSINNNQIWHAGNDGAGSGLDADLIHGKTLQTTFDQIFYVDAVNGNDLNDGSDIAPFATLNKAVDSIMVGGRGIINLLSDITVSTAISAKKKDIYIFGVKSDGTKSIITFNTYVRGSYNTLAGFYTADGSNIGFKNCTINFDLTGIDTTLAFDSFAQVVSYATEAASLTSVRLFQCEVNLPDNSTYALVHSNGAGSMIALSMYSVTINSAGLNSFLAKITAGSLIYNSYSVILTGAKTAHADVISGVIRDANGSPRNILSDMII